MKTSQKVSLYSIDLIRGISILAVILIHTTSRVLEATQYSLKDFPFTLFLNQAFRFAVPMFFLISGFVLELNHHFNESFWHYLKKRFSRILIPYLVWSFLYYFFIYKTQKTEFPAAIFTGEASYQLYFIPSLLVFYFIFPSIHRFYKILSKPVSLIILGLIQMQILRQDYYASNLPFAYSLNVVLFNFYIFILGMVAAHNQEILTRYVSKLKYLLFVVIATFPYLIFVQAQDLYFKTYNVHAIYSQWRVSILIYTIFLSLFLFYFFTKRQVINRVVKKIAKLSFFVFFVHVWVLELVWNSIGQSLFQTFSVINLGKVLFDLSFFGVVTLASFSVAYVVHKSSTISRLLG